MKTVLLVFGTRPEAIKMCPLVIELKKREAFHTLVCVTGQHREMLDQVLSIFQVVPDYDLEVMQKSQTLFQITADILAGMEKVLTEAKPDMVLVHGDTTTAFAAALSSFYLKIPVYHVEAGLRTYDMMSPYPEEFNRQAVGILASCHFAPTQMAADQLIKEGKPEKDIYVTGNTVIDAMKTTIQREYHHELLTWAKGSRLVILTAHRRENLGEPLLSMFRAVKRCVEEEKDVKVIYPVHKNPLVRSAADEVLGNQERIRLIEPLGVTDFHNFLAQSYMIITDSGGIQEEVSRLGKPVLVMRTTTERPEGVAAGTSKLVGTQEENIYQAFHTLLTNDRVYGKMSRISNTYGDGFACVRIADLLERI